MINEETLTLYYYNDGLSDEEHQSVADALRHDSVLAARYSKLCDELDGWRETDDVAVPAHLKHQWNDSIERAARMERQAAEKPGSRSPFLSIAWGGAVAAALALGIAIGVNLSEETAIESQPLVPVANVNNGAATAVPASFTRGLRVYLSDSEWEIARMPIESADERTLLMMQIIEQNRMFERAADQNNAPNVARVLRAFEPILIRLAEEDIAPEDAEALRAQLAFELKVMLTKLSKSTSEEAQTI